MPEEADKVINSCVG